VVAECALDSKVDLTIDLVIRDSFFTLVPDVHVFLAWRLASVSSRSTRYFSRRLESTQFNSQRGT
jgi:hypothetical protein